MADLASRVEPLLASFAEAHGRLVARLEGATDREAGTAPADGGWTPAQIGAHVGSFDLLISRIVTGDLPHAQPAPVGFIERPWQDIKAALTGPLVAPAILRPPADTSRRDALSALATGGAHVSAAFRSLDPRRAALTFTYPAVGTLSLVQLGDWLVAHTIRHNAQMKRALGR